MSTTGALRRRLLHDQKRAPQASPVRQTATGRRCESYPPDTSTKPWPDRAAGPYDMWAMCGPWLKPV